MKTAAREPIYLSWSGGKDCALALLHLQQTSHPVPHTPGKIEKQATTWYVDLLLGSSSRTDIV